MESHQKTRGAVRWDTFNSLLVSSSYVKGTRSLVDEKLSVLSSGPKSMENFKSTGAFQVFSGAPSISGDGVYVSFQIMYEQLGF